MKFWTSKAPRLLRWSCYSRNVPRQSLDLENPPTALHLQDASSPHSPWSWPHQASNKLRRVLASQEQLKDWYHGGKSPHRWDCTYLIKVTCQVTQRDFLCGYLCCDPAIAYKHREHFKYVSFPSQSARGLNSTSIVSAGSPGNQICQEIRFYSHALREKKKENVSKAPFIKDRFATWKKYCKYYIPDNSIAICICMEAAGLWVWGLCKFFVNSRTS